VERVVAWCHEGPGGAHITGLDVAEEEPEGLSGFDVR
jgi:acylphosphatase